MDSSLLQELDNTIRKTISSDMSKVRVFDSHSIINHLFFNHKALFKRVIAAFAPATPEQMVAFRRNIYARIEASSNDLIEIVKDEQSWSVLYDGSFGPCSYWTRLTRDERAAKKGK